MAYYQHSESDAQSSSMAVNTLSYQDELYRPSPFRANPRRVSEATTLSIGSKNMFPPEFGDEFGDEFYYSSESSSSTPSRASSWANRLKRIITLTKIARAFSRKRQQDSRGSSFVGGSYDANGKYLGLERHTPNQAHSHTSVEDKFY